MKKLIMGLTMLFVLVMVPFAMAESGSSNSNDEYRLRTIDENGNRIEVRERLKDGVVESRIRVNSERYENIMPYPEEDVSSVEDDINKYQRAYINGIIEANTALDRQLSSYPQYLRYVTESKKYIALAQESLDLAKDAAQNGDMALARKYYNSATSHGTLSIHALVSLIIEWNTARRNGADLPALDFTLDKIKSIQASTVNSRQRDDSTVSNAPGVTANDPSILASAAGRLKALRVNVMHSQNIDASVEGGQGGSTYQGATSAEVVSPIRAAVAVRARNDVIADYAAAPSVQKLPELCKAEIEARMQKVALAIDSANERGDQDSAIDLQAHYDALKMNIERCSTESTVEIRNVLSETSAEEDSAVYAGLLMSRYERLVTHSATLEVIVNRLVETASSLAEARGVDDSALIARVSLLSRNIVEANELLAEAKLSIDDGSYREAHVQLNAAARHLVTVREALQRIHRWLVSKNDAVFNTPPTTAVEDIQRGIPTVEVQTESTLGAPAE